MDVTDNTSAVSTTPESSAMAASWFTYANHIYFAADIIGRISTLVSVFATCLVLFFIILFKRWSIFNQRFVLQSLLGHHYWQGLLITSEDG